MKKLVMFLICLFSCFCYKVKALNNYGVKSYYNTNTKSFIDSNISVSDNVISYFTTDIDLFKKSYSNSNYSYGSSKMSTVISKLNNGDFDSYISKYDSYIMWSENSINQGGNIAFFNKEDAFLSTDVSNTLTPAIKNGVVYMYDRNQYFTISNQNMALGSRFQYGNLNYNIGFYLNNNQLTDRYSSNKNTTKIYLSDIELINHFFGDHIINPTVSITKDSDIIEDDEIIAVNMNINFSKFDLENYKYQYTIIENIDDEKKWIDFKSDPSNMCIRFDQNGTIFVRVLDLLDNVVSSATFQITKIKTIITYEIEIDDEYFKKNNKKRYNVTLHFINMKKDYYAIYYNLTDGTNKNLGNVNDYKINYVNSNATITVYVYDQNNKMITFRSLNLDNIDKDLNKPHIILMGHDQVNLPNAVAYKYFETTEENRCYYKFGGGELTEESCDTTETKFRKAYYNTSLSIYIYDENNKIVDQKKVNLNFITGLPRLQFESYYNASIKAQTVNIKFLDFEKNDVLKYSYDNEEFETLPTQELNQLNFKKDTDIYFKIYRNNEIIADSFYHVKIGSYSVSISENNTLEEIEQLTESSTSNVSSFLNSISKYIKEFSKVIKYFFDHLPNEIKNFLIAIFTLGLISVIILIARGKR